MQRVREWPMLGRQSFMPTYITHGELSGRSQFHLCLHGTLLGHHFRNVVPPAKRDGSRYVVRLHSLLNYCDKLDRALAHTNDR